MLSTPAILTAVFYKVAASSGEQSRLDNLAAQKSVAAMRAAGRDPMTGMPLPPKDVAVAKPSTRPRG